MQQGDEPSIFPRYDVFSGTIPLDLWCIDEFCFCTISPFSPLNSVFFARSGPPFAIQSVLIHLIRAMVMPRITNGGPERAGKHTLGEREGRSCKHRIVDRIFERLRISERERRLGWTEVRRRELTSEEEERSAFRPEDAEGCLGAGKGLQEAVAPVHHLQARLPEELLTQATPPHARARAKTRLHQVPGQI